MFNCFDCQKIEIEFEICSVNFHDNIELAEEFFLHQKNYLELKIIKKLKNLEKLNRKRLKTNVVKNILKKVKIVKNVPWSMQFKINTTLVFHLHTLLNNS